MKFHFLKFPRDFTLSLDQHKRPNHWRQMLNAPTQSAQATEKRAPHCHGGKDPKSSPFCLFDLSLSEEGKAIILRKIGGEERRDLGVAV